MGQSFAAYEPNEIPNQRTPKDEVGEAEQFDVAKRVEQINDSEPVERVGQDNDQCREPCFAPNEQCQRRDKDAEQHPDEPDLNPCRLCAHCFDKCHLMLRFIGYT